MNRIEALDQLNRAKNKLAFVADSLICERKEEAQDRTGGMYCILSDIEREITESVKHLK